MKKVLIFIAVIVLFSIYACRSKYVAGREFLTDPYAFKGQTIILKLQAKKPSEKYMLFSFDWEQPTRIRFDNEASFDFTDKDKFYLVTFLCRDGNIYHGNFITKVMSYYEQKNKAKPPK